MLTVSKKIGFKGPKFIFITKLDDRQTQICEEKNVTYKDSLATRVQYGEAKLTVFIT